MLRLLVLIAAAWVLSGCSSTIRAVRTPQGMGRTPATSGQLLVYREGEPVPFRYEILGKVFADRRGGTSLARPSEEQLLQMMSDPARAMGGEALVEVHSSLIHDRRPYKAKRWGGAMVARKLPDTVAAGPAPDFIVAIPPIRNLAVDSTLTASGRPPGAFGSSATQEAVTREQDLKRRKSIATVDSLVRQSSRFHLESRGYYSRLIKDEVAPDDVERMAAAEVAQLGGDDTSYILFLTLRKSERADYVLAGQRRFVIDGALYSKPLSKVVWKETGVGTTTSFGLLDNLAEAIDSGGKADVLFAGVRGLFSTLAPRDSSLIQPAAPPAEREL